MVSAVIKFSLMALLLAVNCEAADWKYEKISKCFKVDTNTCKQLYSANCMGQGKCDNLKLPNLMRDCTCNGDTKTVDKNKVIEGRDKLVNSGKKEAEEVSKLAGLFEDPSQLYSITAEQMEYFSSPEHVSNIKDLMNKIEIEI